MAHDTLYIVDNSSDKASVKNYLSEWCSISKQMDIATGYFEVSFLRFTMFYNVLFCT